jgi:hypothetical protein
MDDEIKKLLEENLRLTREIHDMVGKIKHYVNFQKFISLFYFIIIVAPIVIGIIYLPPIIKNMFSQYEQALDMPADVLQNLFQKEAGKINNR